MPELPLLPPIADQPLSVVLLAHQAREHVDTLLPAWISHLDRLARPWEILLADDASSDGTAERAGRNPRVTVLPRDGTPAEGLTLKSALDRCRHPLIFTARLLPRYQPGDLVKFLTDRRAKRPDTGAACPEIDLVHLATGYRTGLAVPPIWQGLGVVWRTFQRLVLGLQPTPLPGWLGLRSHLANLCYRVLFGVCNRDPFSPCRLLRREIVPMLALQSAGSFVHVEILAKATFLGLLLSEDIALSERKRGGHHVPAGEYREPEGLLRRDFAGLLWRPTFGRALTGVENASPAATST